MADIEKFVYYNNGSKKVLKPTDRIVVGSGGLAFEGATADDFELQLTVTDPTDDRSINFPDEDGDIALLQGGALPKALSFPVKNPSTTTALTKGQIVYISGYSGNKPEVSLAQSNSSSTMPAFGFVQNDIAAEAEGYVVYSGLFKGIDTNTNYSEGDTLYVSSTVAGSFQNTPPTGSNLIQNIGKIIRADSSNGELLVGGAGRTNATPNLNEGKIFIGNASNQSSISAYTFPTADGTANQVLQTDGSGTLSFATASSGLSNIVEDTTPQLGGTLDINSQVIQGNLTPSAANTYDLGSSSAEWGDLYLGDSSRVYFGNDQDVFLTHFPDSGLLFEMDASAQSNGDPTFTIRTNSANTSTLGPKLTLQKNSVQTGDTINRIEMRGPSDYYGMIETKLVDATADAEYSTVNFRVMSGGTSALSTTPSGILIEGQSSSTTPKVKISSAYYLPTSDGTSGQIIQTDGSGNLSFASSSGLSNLVEDTTPQLGGTLDINSQVIQGALIPSAADSYDLGSASAEWSGLYLGDSSSIYFGNDQDVKLNHNHNSGLSIEMTTDTISDPTLELKSAYSAQYGGPFIKLNLDSSSPAANDVIGGIRFNGDDSGGTSRQFGVIQCQTVDVSTTNNHLGRITLCPFNAYTLGSNPAGLQVEGVEAGSSKVKVNVSTHNGTDSGLHLGGTLVTSTAAELNYLDGTTMSANGVCKSDATGAFITSDSNLIIESSGHTGLSVQTGDPTTKANYAHIYAKDVSSSAELFVQDEAGNVTQISPHNEEGDWIYWSENIKTGKKVKINMEKMIRRLEVITGESFFEEYIEGES